MRFIALCLAFALVSCSSTNTNTASQPSGNVVINTPCPLTGEPVDSSKTATIDGQTIGFCCNMCLSKFEGMDGEQQKEVLAKASK